MSTRKSIVFLCLLLLPVPQINAKNKKKQLLPEIVLRAERVLVLIPPDAVVKNIFLPPPDAQVYFATSSPSHHGRRSSGVLPLGCSLAAAAFSLVATTPISFETQSSRTVVWWQPWIYLRLVA